MVSYNKDIIGWCQKIDALHINPSSDDFLAPFPKHIQLFTPMSKYFTKDATKKMARFPALNERSFSPYQNPWVPGQGITAELQRKQDKFNHQLMEMQKEAEAKQQQQKLAFEELFNNLHAHLGPQIDVFGPLLVEVTSQPQPLIEDALTIISTSSIPLEITLLTTISSTSVSKERIQELLRLLQVDLEETMERRFPSSVQPPLAPPTTIPPPTTTENLVSMLAPSPPTIPQPLSTKG
ncbi:hypothetical protein GmHk_15G044331 [Glycine max]|nr:hypothetical protein GmHk_15G044331 [Glycine max]